MHANTQGMSYFRSRKRIIYLLYILVIMMMSTESRSQDCQKVKISDFPKKDIPSNDYKSISQEKSYKYYYGIGVPIDYVKARKLAFNEMKKHTDKEDIFEGSTILMMLYANGYGVERNLDISIRLACANVEGAHAEISGRVEHLKEIKSAGSNERFDICDDITSGFMMGYCRSIPSELAEVRRKTTIDSLMKNWPKKDKQAFEKLSQAASHFFDARTTYEVDLTGTARSMFSIEESDSLETIFLSDMLKSDKCMIRPYSPVDFIKADKKMNAIYSTIMLDKRFDDTTVNGEITKEGIKTTQQKWILYRNAWVIFGATRCPKIPASSWKTLITKERIVQLKDLASE